MAPRDVVATLRRRHDGGEFLTALAQERAFEPVGVSLRPPTSAQVAHRFGAVQDWAQDWLAFARRHALRLDLKDVGGRLVGSNAVPARVWVDDAETLWRLLGVRDDVRRYGDVLDLTARACPQLSGWTGAHPRDALANEAVWDRLLAAALWIRDHGGPGVYLRQIDVPGVDTKFVETHRSVLAALLEEIVPPERIDVGEPRTRLAARFGLARKPSYVRLRRLDGEPLLPPSGPAELALRVDDLVRCEVSARRVVIVENDVTYLAFPPLPDAVAVFGEGYAVSRLAPVRWLADREVHYWGDLDTHGFAILDQLRVVLPQARSLLMDAATLLDHEAHWSREDVIRNASLERLTAEEASLYADLVEGRYGDRVRLEQERVRFGYLRQAVGARLTG
jgi:hypothetical protein